jgi:hypothetical protein
MKYKKKPVIIITEATQWFKNGDHPEDDCHPVYLQNQGELSFISEGKIVRYYRQPGDGNKKCEHCNIIMHEHGWIDTLEGGFIVCPGDYIITGIKGERYPCKPDIFLASYEPVE